MSKIGNHERRIHSANEVGTVYENEKRNRVEEGLAYEGPDECKTHLCFEFISHAILSILYPYSFKTHNISSKISFAGFFMESM